MHPHYMQILLCYNLANLGVCYSFNSAANETTRIEDLSVVSASSSYGLKLEINIECKDTIHCYIIIIIINVNFKRNLMIFHICKPSSFILYCCFAS